MKFHSFLILSLAAISNIVAQNSFEPAYIITSENDTVQGYILEKTDAELAKKILFKADKNSVIKTYRSNELKGFGFDDRRIFEQMPVAVSEEDTLFVFVKKIVEGKIDLFVWRHAHQTKPDVFLNNNRTNQIIALTTPAKRNLRKKDGSTYLQIKIPDKSILEDTSFVGEILPLKNPAERKIKKEIIKYNRKFNEVYPVKVYREQVSHNYDILAGLPINTSEELHFRVGVYRNKSRIERTTNFSFIQGIVYHHRSNTNKNISILPEGNSIYRWQFLNVIPLGVNFHGNSKNIQPYGYAGLGVGVIMAEDRVVVAREQLENEISYQFLPTVNVGMGIKWRLGKTYLITELTPTINSLFWNIGISR